MYSGIQKKVTDEESRSRRFWSNFMAAVILALGTYFLYHTALNACWTYDDGYQLGFVTKYRPWQYFFIPEITRQHDPTNVTPWNPLTYDINLRLFGFSTFGFYAHQIIDVCLAAFGTFLLLRLWTGFYRALFGAIIFLTGAPTLHIANELMTGHYLEGLILMIAAFYFYIQALRKESFRLALAGAIFYLISLTTKEIYVPLPIFFVFIPEGNFARRFKYALPYFVCAAVYVPWRYAVLGKIVGGKPLSYAVGFDPELLIKTFAKIPFLLLGKDALGIFMCVCIAGLLLWGIYAKRIAPALCTAALLLMLLPLVPLAHYPGINAADRYLFLPWWAISCCTAIILPPLTKTILKNGLTIVLCAFILLTAVRSNLWERKSLSPKTEKIYRFILNSDNTQVFLCGDGFFCSDALNGILKADEKFNPKHKLRAAIISDEAELEGIDRTTKTVWSYSEKCKCVEDITTNVPSMLQGVKERSALHRELKLHNSFQGIHIERSVILDNIFVRGRQVTLEGWANLPDTETRQTIHVFLSAQPVNSLIEIVKRPDVAETIRDDKLMFSGFKITLYFSTGSDAKRAASDVCVAADSATRPQGVKERSALHRELKLHNSSQWIHIEKAAGFIDNIFVQGGQVTLDGWANLPDTETRQTIHVFLSAQPVNSLIEIVKRPDVVKTIRDDKLMFSGFKITLYFSTGSDAKRAASDVCVAADSATRPLLRLNSTNNRCSI